MGEQPLELVVLLWAHPEKVDALRRFEQQAVSIMAEHGGRLVHAVAPSATTAGGEPPTEVHVLSFRTRAGFEAYRADPRLAALGPLRAEAIRETVVMSGTAVTYA
ncbi:MAG: DUF1330 domain-containing protein [Chromatiales bacterium]|nr:DUF1330 domain-containing protein [Chromatiales bacterium]